MTNPRVASLAVSLALLPWSCLATSGASAGTLEDIRGRGVVTCAVSENAPGLSENKAGQRSGLAVDLCGVLAAAVLGNRAAVAFVDVKAGEAIVTLQAEEADVLLVPGPWSFGQEVNDGVLLTEPLLRRAADGLVFGPTLRQGDDSWFVAVRWILEALRKGPDSVSAEAQQQGEAQLGLAPDWAKKSAYGSNSYKQFIETHMKTLEAAGWSLLPGPDGMTFGPKVP